MRSRQAAPRFHLDQRAGIERRQRQALARNANHPGFALEACQHVGEFHRLRLHKSQPGLFENRPQFLNRHRCRRSRRWRRHANDGRCRRRGRSQHDLGRNRRGRHGGDGLDRCRYLLRFDRFRFIDSFGLGDAGCAFAALGFTSASSAAAAPTAASSSFFASGTLCSLGGSPGSNGGRYRGGAGDCRGG